MERGLRAVVEFTAAVLHEILEKRISLDLAFKTTLRRYGKLPRGVTPRALYRLTRSVALSYYTLRFLEERVYGARGGTRRLVRLWLVYMARPEDVPESLSSPIERLRRRFMKTWGRRAPESLEEAVDGLPDAEKLAVIHSYPRWLVEKLLAVTRDRGWVERLLASLNEEQWWIRVNTLKASVEKVERELEEAGVVFEEDRELPYMLRVIDYREPLHHLDAMWRGEIVFQDKASAMVVEALEPSEGDLVLDMTGAPGIKASLVMQLTENKARIILADLSLERLKRARRLLRLYGVDEARVDIVNTDSMRFKPRITPTKILLDAPCSSTGTIGKDPAVKIHLSGPSWASRFPRIQSLLARNAASIKAPTIYSVCSILPQEGEEVIEALEAEPFTPRVPGLPGYPPYRLAHLVRRFYPHVHGTQGFFIAGFAG